MAWHAYRKGGIEGILALIAVCVVLTGCPPRKPTPIATPAASLESQQWNLNKEGDTMLAELTIIPLGRGQHISSAIAPAISLIETSGLPFQLTPSGTCIEGDWDRVMPHPSMPRSGSPKLATRDYHD